MSASSSVDTSTSLRRFLNGRVDSDGSLLLVTIFAILLPSLVILNLGKVCSGFPVSLISVSILSSSTRSLFCSQTGFLSNIVSQFCSLLHPMGSSSPLFLSLFIVKSKGPSVSAASGLFSVFTLFAQWAWTNAEKGIGIGMGSGIGSITG